MKLWSGRFTSKSDRLTEDFNASITVDSRMYRQDIKGSIAHARMLARQGIVHPGLILNLHQKRQLEL
jgi:argininosuccinate lyase